MKKQSFPVTNIGSVSLLMVFIVLCLVTFATLSLSSAASDYHFSQNIAEHNTEYYNASNNATLRLLEIEELLKTTYKEQPGDYMQAVSSRIKKLNAVECDFSSDKPIITYQEALNETQALLVTLVLSKPTKSSDSFYRITSWQQISTADWEGGGTLKLIK